MVPRVINEFGFLFGILNCKDFALLNHVILIGKQVIYRCKNKLIKPEFEIFLHSLKRVYNIEMYIPQRREALEKNYS